MKTFNENDLITWSNRDKAEIGKRYYYANTIKALQSAIAKNRTSTLTKINGNDVGCPFCLDDGVFFGYFACILKA